MNAEWRLHVYWQGGEETTDERATFAEIRADLERVAPNEGWVYIERCIAGSWQRVAFAGYGPPLPDAWSYTPDGTEAEA